MLLGADLFGKYVIHWWSGDANNYYKLMWFEISQANKIFKIGLYAIGLTALFDLIKFKELITNTRNAYCSVTFTFRYARRLFNIYSIIIRLLFIPAYYITSKFDGSKPLPLRQLIKEIFDYHVSKSVDEARWITSKKWINRFLLWMERNPPTDRELRVTVYVLFVILSALEILTSS